MLTSPLLAAIAALQAAPAQQVAPARVDPEPARIALEAGESAVVEAAVFGAEGSVLDGMAVTWLALAPEVAQVDQDGRVTAVSPGEARVAARAGNAMGFVTVVVRALPVAEIVAALPSATLVAGTSAPLRVHATDDAGEAVRAPSLIFASSDPRVAEVDATGRVFARTPGRAEIAVDAGGARSVVQVEVRDGSLDGLRVVPQGAEVRTGDVVRFEAQVRDAAGTALHPAWSVDGAGAQIEPDGGQGVFVAEEPGTYRVTALVGEGLAASTLVAVSARIDEAELVKVGRGAAADHHSGDTWVFEGVDGRDYAYVGTFMYDWMKAWDVTDPASPVLTDSVQLDARRINDVKIHASNRIGILTREGASDRRNGIVILDLAEPAHPTVISEYKRTVPGGVHNVWIEGDLVYAVHNGTSDIHVIDISDPAAPDEVGRWGMPESPTKSLHDVIVRTATPTCRTGTTARSCSTWARARTAALPPSPPSCRATSIPPGTRTPLGEQVATCSWATRSSPSSGTRTRRSKPEGTFTCWTWPIPRTRWKWRATRCPRPAPTTSGWRGTGCTSATTKRACGSWTSPASCAATSTAKAGRSRSSRPPTPNPPSPTGA